MNLKLSRPIVFFDLETTGVNLGSDRIVEIAMIKIWPDGSQKIKSLRINPEMKISAESTSIHHISDDDVKDKPTFKQEANNIKQFMDNCDLGGFNSNKFDIPLLIEEFLRVGIDFQYEKRRFLDAQKIFFQMEPRNLAAAYKFYCDKTLENAHSAEADAVATWEVLDAQLAKYPQLGDSLDSILKVVGEDDVVDFARRMVRIEGVICFNFGKHKGRSVEDVLQKERSYYDWMMQGDFPQHTKQKLTEILTRMMLHVKKP
jgi:DNA polymerase-3 subunit epsilon